MKRNAILTALLVTCTADLAYAHDGNPVATTGEQIESVYYQPAELATHEGVQDLQRRVRQAARRLCSNQPSFMTTYAMSCYYPTVRDALRQVNHAVARGRDGATMANAASIIVRAR